MNIERQTREWDAVQRDAKVRIPTTLDFSTVPGISAEMSERLEAVRPATLAHAARMAGVTPAALSALYVAASRKVA